MGRAKRHHQAPQAYLKQFADGDGRVHVYDRISQETRPLQPVKNAAVESNLYTFTDADGNPNDSFEQGPLARIDDKIAKLIPKLLEPDPVLTTPDRVAVDMFIALQYMRTRAVRDFLEDSIDLALRLEVEMNIAGASPERIEKFIDERYPNASEEERVEIRRIAADPSQPTQLSTLD